MNLSFIRAPVMAFIATVLLLVADAALSAPTCEDRNGLTIRCGTEGAMPVGWTLPPEERSDRQKFRPAPASVDLLLELICTLGVFFSLMALLPEFDGQRAGEWDRQEGDDLDHK
jgi:hypothetical protein